MAHWTDEYIGRKHIERVDDCAQLVIDVQAEVFGRVIGLPVDRESDAKPRGAITHEIDATQVIKEGDIAVLKSVTRDAYHVGVYAFVNNAWYILHSLKDAGTCLHKARLIGHLHLEIVSNYSFVPVAINMGHDEESNEHEYSEGHV